MAQIDYPIRNRPAKILLAMVDRLLRPFSHVPKPIPPPKSLLLSNSAHLGDVILTTSLLPPLKAAYPDLKIGMLVVIENHPLIDHIHTLDHWKTNRSPLSWQKKFRHYQRTRSQALQEIQQVGYDIAIDCPFHFPNFAPLLFRAKIPTRIGFNSAGFGPLLTHPCEWSDRSQAAALTFFSLLENLPSLSQYRDKICPTLPIQRPFSKRNYLVIHIGSGNPNKEWSKERWRDLAKLLIADGYQLYFTGQGERERKTIEWITKDLPQTENLCDQLSWQAFVSVIDGAKQLIGVDSCAGHVAAAMDTPSLLLYADRHTSNLWKPYSEKATIITDLHNVQPQTIYSKITHE